MTRLKGNWSSGEFKPVTYIGPFNLLATDILESLEHLMISHDLVVHVNILVDGSGVGNYPGYLISDGSHIGKGYANISLSGNVVCVVRAIRNHIVDTSRRDFVGQDLIPPGHVDDGVRDLLQLDVVDDFLFLFFFG